MKGMRIHMRVENDYLSKNQQIEKNSSPQVNSKASKSDTVGAFAWDVSSAVPENKAYGDLGKTIENVRMDAEQTNVALQKDYMIVMSNTMSTEDYAKLEEEGFDPSNIDFTRLVTVTDKIKAELIQAGVQVEGYTDDIDLKQLTEITGNQSLAQNIIGKLAENDVPVTADNVEDVNGALEKTKELSELSEGALKYMLQTEKEATIDNLYKAQFSAGLDSGKQGKGYYAQETTGYYAKKADSYEWDKVMPQIEKVIVAAGQEINKETVEDAKWLIEKGIPLTKDSLNNLMQLKELSFSEEDTIVIDTIAKEMAAGKTAGDAILGEEKNIFEQAADILNQAAHITEEAVKVVASAGETFTIKNLAAAQRQIEDTSLIKWGVSKESKQENTKSEATAKRQLEEIRLKMSLEANVSLLKKGFEIDTSELEDLVEALKNAEKEQNSILFDGEEKVTFYEEIITKTAEIASMPAAVLGKAITEGTVFTLNYVHREGTLLQSAYEAAGETYEALMTAPRKDLGDSIKKAFRNVDSLLEEVDFPQTESNRRAVRILGYNNMPIQAENIEAVKAADEKLNRVLQKLTPAATLQMVRDKINPLDMSMQELEEYLSGMEDTVLQETEKFSKYLYKLEKSNQIGEEERKAYIDVYKLLHQIEKSDGAVIGSLINQGAEISFKNLLSAARTQRQKGMNVSVNDSFGGMEAKNQSLYHEDLLKDIMDQASPEKLSKAISQGNVPLEVLAEQVKQEYSETEKNLDKEYRKTGIENVRRIKDVENHVIRALTDFDQPVTVDNLMAAEYLTKSRGATYKDLQNKAKDADKNRLLKAERKLSEALGEAIDNLQINFTEDAVQESYRKIEEVAEKVLKETADSETPKSLDIKSMALTFKQISLATNLAKEENFEVPIKIGEEITSINLRILHGKNETGKVTATMNTENYGEVAAEFSVEEEGVSGYVASNDREKTEELKKIETKFAEALKKEGKQIKALTFMTGKDMNIQTFSEEAKKTMNVQKVSSKELYQIAKSFIYSLQMSDSSR